MAKVKFIERKNNDLYYPDVAEQARTNFIPEIVHQLLGAIQTGISLEDSAKILMMDPQQVERWRKSNYCNFGYAVERARVALELKHLRRVGDEKITDTKDDKWLLEKFFKDKYGKEITVNMRHMLPIIDKIVTGFVEIITTLIKDPELLREISGAIHDKFSRKKLTNDILEIDEAEVIE